MGDTASEANPIRVNGALATAPQVARRPADVHPVYDETGQRLLFNPPQPKPHKVIPFESIATSRGETAPVKAAPRTATRRPAAPKPPDTQAALDFLPPAPQAARKLKTTVEAVIYCDAPVASKMHRAVAAAMDFSMVLMGYGLFLLAFHLGGGDFLLNRATMGVFTAAFVLIALFYGMLWVLAQSDSPGRRWASLRLTNFDGFPPDATQRALRFAGTVLSLTSLGAGVAWALADEESLTWHDHMSKTFLTVWEADTSFFRQR
ncbi:MAG: RDD family protein [Acidobacteria bacterium]|nr:RDD family protein [Acidobacteriota bacterium]